MRVSVVVPTYNHARYVEACLLALREQTQSPDEVIVIDDGSVDATWDIVCQFQFPHHVKYVRLQTENRGAHAALNHGLDLASGDWVFLCNSDDAFAPERVERMLGAIARTGAQFGFSRCRYIDDSGRDVTQDLDYTRDLWDKQQAIASFASVGFSLLHSNVTISTGNFVMSRNLQRAVGYFRPYRYVHDWDYALRVLLVTEPLYVEDSLYSYRIHPNNSFHALAEVAAVECPELMRRYMKASTGYPINLSAPCSRYWPIYFSEQIERLGLSGYLSHHGDIDSPVYVPAAGTHGRMEA